MDRKIEPGTQTDKNVATQTKYAGSSTTSEKSGYRWEKEETIAEKRLSISPLLFISFKLLDSTLDLVPMGVFNGQRRLSNTGFTGCHSLPNGLSTSLFSGPIRNSWYRFILYQMHLWGKRARDQSSRRLYDSWMNQWVYPGLYLVLPKCYIPE